MADNGGQGHPVCGGGMNASAGHEVIDTGDDEPHALVINATPIALEKRDVMTHPLAMEC
jgi:hypothetical protein